MKRMIPLLVIAAVMMVLFTGCCLKHEWAEATCDAPKTCSKCSATEGDPLGHEWEDATCIIPQTCSKCAATEGDPLGHEWEDATCIIPQTCFKCATTEGDPLEHTVDSWTKNGDKMEGSCTICDTKVSKEGTLEEIANTVIVDYWIGYEVSSGGNTMALDSTYNMEFFDDGTCSICLGDDSWSGTWEFYDYSDYGVPTLSYLAYIDGSIVIPLIFDNEPNSIYVGIKDLIFIFIR